MESRVRRGAALGSLRVVLCRANCCAQKPACFRSGQNLGHHASHLTASLGVSVPHTHTLAIARDIA
eukprot:8228686-Alexandrium_andersonii.AAC.1